MSELSIFWDMPKEPKSGFNKLNNEGISQICTILIKKHWKLCLRLKYTLGMNFIELLKETLKL